MSAFLDIAILVAVKMTMLPASKCWPTDMRGMFKLGMRWHWVVDGGKTRGRFHLEVACIVDLFPAAILSPRGVGVSFKRGVILSHKLMVQPVSAVIISGGNTDGLLGRGERAHEE